MKKITFKIFIFFCFFTIVSFAQRATHEVGLFTGSSSLQSDFGERKDFLSTYANNSMSFGVTYHTQLNSLTTRWRSRSSFLDHVMIKGEVYFLSKTKLEHHGIYVEGASPNPTPPYTGKDILNNMVGEVSMTTIGLNVEYYLTDLTRYFYSYRGSRLNPFVNLGINYAFFSNNVYSLLGDWNTNPSLKPTKYQPEGFISPGSGSTIAFNMGIGSRFKLTERLDISAQMNWMLFGSDKVDGVDADLPENKRNETMATFNLGIIYHINFLKNL